LRRHGFPNAITGRGTGVSRTARWIFIVTVVVVTAVFSRLGVWQLHRFSERKADNARRVARGLLPPLRIPGEAGPRDLPLVSAEGAAGSAGDSAAAEAADTLAWRKATLTGRYDWDREVVLRDRSWQGAPGVYVLTPLVVRSGGDSAAILVLRGFLPAADAYHARLGYGRPDTAAGREGVSVTLFTGAPAPGLRVDTLDGPRGPHAVVGHLDPVRIGRLLPYPVADLYAQVTDSTPGSSYPFRVPLPELGHGPFLSYAIQWFALATISVVGGVIFLRAGPGGPGGKEAGPVEAGEPEEREAPADA